MKLTDTEVFLQKAHLEAPGYSPICFSRGYADGQTSYEMLANELPRVDRPLRVLDLACGDGFFLEKLASRSQQGLKLTGADMSEGELACAKRRPLLKEVPLQTENARALSFSSETFDFVTCHMALMLMDEIEKVISEIRRVLVPSGRLAAFVSGSAPPSPVYTTFNNILDEVLGHEGKTWKVNLGDSRARSAEGLMELFAESAGFKNFSTTEIEFQYNEPPEYVMEHMAALYNVFLLSHEGREVFRKKLLAAYRHLAEKTNGKLTFALRMRKFSADKI